MSNDRHPDLDFFYDDDGGEEGQEVFFVEEDEEMEEDDELDDDFIPDYDDYDDEEVVDEEDEEWEPASDDGDGDDAASIWRHVGAMMNASNGQISTSLIAQLLSGRDMRERQPVLTDNDLARIAAERKQNERKWWKPQVKPHPNGVELLKGGEFGRVGGWQRRQRRRVSRAAKPTIPNTHGTIVASYPSVPYVGQYAREDYSLFYAATQYFTLHLYDTAKPGKERRRPTAGDAEVPSYTRRGVNREDTSMAKIKTVQGVEGSWTVTDCDADKKGEKMIYSSITPYVHMLYTGEDDTEHIELDFTSSGGRGYYNSFGIWSIRFSADGKEVAAGAGNGQIMVYDLEAERRSLSVSAHADDVNAVCFADESSTNILVSGSDDGYVKIWDRRSLSSSTPSGILVGATEGITYTSPKGDGRYIVVNSKDQAARLYDLRKMKSYGDFENEPDAVSKYGQPHFDYRSSRYPPPRRLAHPQDCSVMTYRGHAVLQTLIRCHFSPRESTGQSYIYSGSADGMIHIWSLDGRVVQVLNRAQSLPLRGSDGQYNDPSATESNRSGRTGAMPYEMGHSYAVRDVSWHGYEPTLMSTCWEVDGGYRRGGTVAKHEWKGLGKGGLKSLEDWVEKKQRESGLQPMEGDPY